MNTMLRNIWRYFLAFLIFSTAMGGLFLVINLFTRLMTTGSADIFAVADSENQAVGLSNGSVIVTIAVLTLGIPLAGGAIFLINRWRIVREMNPSQWIVLVCGGTALMLVTATLYMLIPDALTQDLTYAHHIVDPSRVQPGWLLSFSALFFLSVVVVIARLRNLRVPMLLWLALLWPAAILSFTFFGGSGLSGLGLFKQVGPVQLSPAYANAVGEYRNGSNSIVEGSSSSLLERIDRLSTEASGQRTASMDYLRQSGASVNLLETGGAVVRRDGLSWWVPGTTARQAPSITRTPVFELEGATHISFLRTATGDVYENGNWVQKDPETLTYDTPSTDIREIVRSAVTSPSDELRALPAWRVNSSLLIGNQRFLNDATVNRLTIRPRASRHIPPSVVPSSLHLEGVSERGRFRPFSVTFSTADSVVEYSFESRVLEFSRQELLDATPASDYTYTQLPENLPSRVTQLAQEITTGIATPYEKAKAIESYLISKYAYVFVAPLDQNTPPLHRDPVDWFLFERQTGTSGNFSSAFVVLARSLGIPARVVSGWVVGQMEESQTVFSDQAHQWAEVAFENLGWIAFDPTPPGGPASRTPRVDDTIAEQLQSSEYPGNDATLVTEVAAERLVLDLDHADPVVRKSAAIALGNENYPEAIGHLIRRTLFDDDPEVRQAAGEALNSFVREYPDVFERLVETALFDNDRRARVLALNLLLAGLNSRDVLVRRAAAEALPELGEVEAIGLLVRSALFDADDEVRKSSAESLGKLDSVRARDLLGESLGDEDPTVRHLAAQALGYLGDLAAIDPLLKAALYDENAGVRRTAALALASLKHSRALNLVVDELGNEDPRVRAAAAAALGQLGDLPHVVRWLNTMLLGTALYDDDVGVRRSATGALGNLDRAKALILLVETLSNESWTTRIAAAEALGFLGDSAAIGPLVVVALLDEREIVRKSAVEALRTVDPKRALEGLLDALDYASESVREAAAEALTYLGDPAAADPLLEILLFDESRGLRQAAAEALRTLEPTQTLAKLLEFLDDDSPDRRQAAARALGHLGDSAAVDALGRIVLFDIDPDLRWAAVTALGTLEDEGVFQYLLEALRDIDPRVQEASAQVLGDLGDGRSVSPLIDVALFDDDQSVREAAAHALGSLEVNYQRALTRLVDVAVSADNPYAILLAVDALVWLLSNPDTRVLEATLEALGELGHSSAIDPLIGMFLSHDDQGIRGAAGQALLALAAAGSDAFNKLVEAALAGGDESARAPIADFLVEALNDDEPLVRIAAAEALGHLNEPAGLTPLGAAARSDVDARVRQAAARALGKLNYQRSLELLLEVLHDSDSDVRNAAVEALGELGYPEAVPQLLQVALFDGGEQVRQSAVKVLKDLDPVSSLAFLLFSLVNPDSYIRSSAVGALTMYGGSEVFDPLLNAALTDESSEVRGKAVEALNRLEPARALDALLDVLDDADPSARSAAVEAFGNLGNLDVFEPLIKVALTDDIADIRLMAVEVVDALNTVKTKETLIEALSNSDPRTRQAAAEAFGILGPGGVGVVEALLATVADSDPFVREAALRALEPFGNAVRLESGGILVPISGEYAIVQGTTARQATEPTIQPIMQVHDAGHTSYLRVATGDVYNNGYWVQQDPVSVPFEDYDHIPGLVRAVIDGSDEELGALPSERRNLALLAGYETTPRISNTNSISVQSIGYRFVPDLAVPSSLHLRDVSQSGNLRPFSATMTLDSERRGYTWNSSVPIFTQSQLTQARLASDSTYTELPDDLPDRIERLAVQISELHQSPYAKARAIESYLTSEYTYAFADPSNIDPVPEGRDPVDWFLFDHKEGTCGNFSSAFVLLARSIGLPARVVSGWTITPTNELQTVNSNQAHQWAEVAFEGLGWITFDPTVAEGAPSRTEEIVDDGEGQGGSRGQVEALLSSDDPNVRAEAAQALGESGDGNAVDALVTALSDSDATVRAEAASALEGIGASVVALENGGSLIINEDLGYWVPGTTTAQAAGLAQNPIFEVRGAAHTGYLRTAVGDVYENGWWRQLDPVEMGFRPPGVVSEVVLSAIGQAAGPFSAMSEERLDLALLTKFQTTPRTTYTEVISISPLGSITNIPAGTLPTSPHLETLNIPGMLWPYSKTLSSDNSVPSYSWTSLVPQYDQDQLAGAEPSSDSTYTQLPDDLPSRIRELAVEITSDHVGTYAKAQAIAAYLGTNYPYRLADSLDDFPPAGRDPVDWFLFDHKEGTCGVYSSAFVVLARSVGIPSRVVSGWMISENAGSQTVYSDQGHQWAEVALAGIGWVTFEPTASGGAPTRVVRRSQTTSVGETESTVRTNESIGDDAPTPTPPPTPVVHDTVVEITEWPSQARKALPFTIAGTVLTTTGAPVDGLDVEIFINEKKEQGGTKVGFGTANSGRFEIVIQVPKAFEGGNYQLIAHAIGNSSYNESWSDPEISIYSGTEFELTGPSQLPVDTEAVFRGKLFDETGVAVAGYSVDVKIDDIGQPPMSTDSQGVFRFTTTFDEPGFHLIEVSFEESEFLLGNVARFPVEVTLPTRITLGVPPHVGINDNFLVEGALRDTRGHPLADREILLTVGELFSDLLWTDAQGAFQIPYVLDDPGDYTVTAEYRGEGPILFSTAQAKVAVRAIPDLAFWGPQRIGVGVIGNFAGEIHSNEGAPIADAGITIEASGSDEVTTVTSDANGAFEFQRSFGLTGPAKLVANFQADNWLPASSSVTVTVVQHTSLTVSGAKTAVLGHPYLIEGVLRSTSGNPILKGSVLVEVDGQMAARLDTGPNGVFSWETTFLQPSEPTINVRFPGTETLDPAQAVLNLTVGAPSVVVEPPEPVIRGDTLTLRGVVVVGDRLTPNTQIVVPGNDPVQTNPAGAFVIRLPIPTDAEPGSRELELSAPSLSATARVPITINVPTELEVNVPSSVAVGEDFVVRGTLRDDRREPLAGMSIDLKVGEFQHGVLETDQQGNFEVTHRVDRPGELVANVEFKGTGLALQSRTNANIRARYRAELLLSGPPEIELAKTAAIAGKLISASGAPIASAVVHIDDARGRRLATVSPDESGTFEFSLTFDETGLIALTASIDAEGTWSPSSAALTAKVVIPTHISFQGPKTALIDKPYLLEGFLKDVNGTPISGEPVTIEIDGVPVTTLTTRADGAFSWETVFDSVGETVVSVGFEGTDHLDSDEVDLRVFAGVPSLVVETPEPIARGDRLLIRGSVTVGSEVISHAGITVGGKAITQSSLAGTFVIHHPIASDAQRGSFEIEVAAPSLNVSTRVPVQIKSTTSVVLFPLEKVKLGQPLILEAKLLDDRREGIPGAILRVGGSNVVTTDSAGVSMVTMQTPLDGEASGFPVEVVFEGDDTHFPSTYSLHLPIPEEPFNWWLWVGLPLMLVTGPLAAYLVGRRTSTTRTVSVESSEIAAEVETRPTPAKVEQASVAESLQPALVPEVEEPVKEPVQTHIEVAFKKPDDDLPSVWNVGEKIQVLCTLKDTDGVGIFGRELHVTLPGSETPLEMVTDQSGHCTTSLDADSTGEFRITAKFFGIQGDLHPSTAFGEYRVVEFREEIVRLYNVFLERAGQRVTGLSDQSTPREAELLVATSGVPVDERALEELIARFEEADYSEHEIGRRQYEAMYRAWSTIAGEWT